MSIFSETNAEYPDPYFYEGYMKKCVKLKGVLNTYVRILEFQIPLSLVKIWDFA